MWCRTTSQRHQRLKTSIHASESYGVNSLWQVNPLKTRNAERRLGLVRNAVVHALVDRDANTGIPSALRKSLHHTSDDWRCPFDRFEVADFVRTSVVPRGRCDHFCEGRSMHHQNTQAKASDTANAATIDP